MQQLRRMSVVVALTLAACGGKKAATGGGEASCNAPVHHECTEYSKDNRAIGDEPLKRLCDGFEGTFAATPCPTAARPGACRKDQGTKVYYQGYEISAAELEKDCTAGQGTWKAP